MAKYIVQLRRGWKWTQDPETGEPRDDWAKYSEENPESAVPLAGELVVEYDNGVPRLKIGDGIHPFAELEYMSIDSFILPKQPVTINLFGGDAWVSISDDRYEQDITVQLNGLITENSKIDLQPTPEQLASFHEQDVAFTTINEDGRIKVYAVGTKPQNDHKGIPVTITEVITNG